MKVLFVNACPRPRGKSRTLELCDEFLKDLDDADVIERNIFAEGLLPYTEADTERRDELIAKGDTSSFTLAREFAEAELVVIGAPYWDMSFPAALKVYVEHICVNGVNFIYTETGAKGLAKAKFVVYITTAGGFIGENDFGCAYIRGIGRFFGIEGFIRIAAEGLDIEGFDVAGAMDRAKIEAARAAESI